MIGSSFLEPHDSSLSSATRNRQYHSLCTVPLNAPMSLAQLAVLLQAVYQHSVHYQLLTYQCYWHAYTVWEILRKEFRGDVSQNKLEDRRGKYMGVNIRREDSVESITNAYKSAWVAFCDEETRTRQQAEDVIRQVGCCQVIFSRTLVDLSPSG
jgi:hypothetical protein